MVGDGSWLMMSSEIATSIQEGARITVVLIDNHGFGSIGGLSRSLGSEGFGTAVRGRRSTSSRMRRSLGAIADPGRDAGRADRRARCTPAAPTAPRDRDRLRSRHAGSAPTSRGGTCRWRRSRRCRRCSEARADYERRAGPRAAVPGRFGVSERRAHRRGRGGDDRAGRAPPQPLSPGRPVRAGGRGRPVGACARWRSPSVTGPRRGDVADLLAGPLDALLVAVPDPLHAGTVLAALAAGLHVFCEKPLCFTEARGGRDHRAAATGPAGSSRSAT